MAFDANNVEWRQLISNDPTAHLYHRNRWIEVLRRTYRLEFYLALLRSDRKVRGGALFARSPGYIDRRIVALPFSDRCEPLVSDQDAAEDLLRLLARTEERPCEIRGVPAPEPWSVVDCFVNWELDVSCTASQLYERLSSNFRRNIVKAGRNAVTITNGNSLDHLWRFKTLHDESRRRQGLPSQPRKFFQTLWDVYGANDDAEVWLAAQHGRDLSAVFLLHDEDRVYYKWSARTADDTLGGGHLLSWKIVESLAGKASLVDLGRTDRRNHGLNRFKHELGAKSSPLPYSFFGQAPQEISSEVMFGLRRLSSQIWRHLPRPLCRALSDKFYRYLA